MVTAFSTRKRHPSSFFGNIEEVAADAEPHRGSEEHPTSSFLMVANSTAAGRPRSGLQAVFKSRVPDQGLRRARPCSEFVKYEFEAPKYDVEECQPARHDLRSAAEGDAAPHRVRYRSRIPRLKSVKDIKEQDVYMGDMPLMTDERHLHRQRHRARHRLADAPFAGRLLRPRQGQDPFLGQAAVRRAHHPLSRLVARLSSSTPRTSSTSRIDRRRKIPVTTLLFALGMDDEDDPRPLLQDDRLHAVTPRAGRVPYDPGSARSGLKATVRPGRCRQRGEVAASRPATKIDGRSRRASIAEKRAEGPARQRRGCWSASYIAEDVVDLRSNRRNLRRGRRGAIMRRGHAGDDRRELIGSTGTESRCSTSTTSTVGAYIRNTLAVDKNSRPRGSAVRHLPRHAPGRAADARDRPRPCSSALFFDTERYDLSAVGRVKMNMRLELRRVGHRSASLRKRGHPRGRQGAASACATARGEIDDIDHLGNRRVRSVGELMENQYRVGLLRMERAIKERMSLGRHRHRDAAGPDQRQAGGSGRARVLRLARSSVAVHGPDQPALGSHAQASSFGAWPGWSDPRARRLRGARRAPDALRPHLPDRNAGRPEHRPDQLARDLRAREQVRLHREPLPQGPSTAAVTDEVVYLSAMEEAQLQRRPGQRRGRRQGQAR